MKKTGWIAAIALVMTGAAIQAETVVYQSNFDTATTLAEAGLASAGASGGLWKLDTDNERIYAAFPGGNDRATVKNTGGWQSAGGITLDVTFNQLATSAKFSIGLFDVGTGDWNNGNDFIQDGTFNAPYSIGFSTDGALEDANGNKDVLSFNNGTTVSKLSDAQGDITTNTLQTLSLTITSTGYSYSLNGGEATTGSGSFDMSKSYGFVAYGNNAPLNGSYISNITVTTLDAPTVWELDMGTDPVLTNWTVRSEGKDNYTLTNGVMTMSSETLLDTEPLNTFKGLTQVDLQWRSITESDDDFGAFLWANVDGDAPDKYSVIFQSHLNLSNNTQTVKIVNGAGAEHTGFSTNMLTLSATLDAFNEKADYIVTDGAYSVTNTISLAANLGAANYAITLGTVGPSAEVAYVRVEANARPDEALLVASDEIAMELIDPATTVTGTNELEYATASTTLEITAITVSDESHEGVFSVLTAAPQTLDSTGYGTTNLVVEFDNSVVGVVGTATGLVTVSWTEAGSGVTNDTVVPVSAYYAGAAEPDVTWDGGGNGVNWGDAANWDTDEVPGTYADGSALIGNGGSATVATNFTGTYAYDVIVSNSSTLNIAADLQNVDAMDVGTDVGSAATVNQTTGAVASASLNISVAGNTTNAVYNLSGGSHDVSVAVTVQANGLLNVDGGALAANTVTVADGAVLRLTDGSVDLGGASTYGVTVNNGGVIEIEGGSFDLAKRINLKAGGIFRVIGDEADVSLYQFSGQANGKVEFVLDETGVSPLVFSSWGTLAVGEGFAIDGSAYANGPADILLYQSTSPVGLLDGKYNVTGLGDENVDWAITESTNSGHTITLNILGNVEIGDITMGGVNEDGDIVFSWDTVDGQAYNVETNANLVFPNWGVYETFVGDGTAISFTNTPALDQLFYKVTSE